jgi:hypothetical protein
MKSVLLIGAAAGGVAIIGGVLAWQWMIGAGAIVLLVVILLLPWVRTEAGRQTTVAERETRGRTH